MDFSLCILLLAFVLCFAALAWQHHVTGAVIAFGAILLILGYLELTGLLILGFFSPGGALMVVGLLLILAALCMVIFAPARKTKSGQPS